MKALLEAAGRQFLQQFAAALIVYGVGILAAPDLAHTYLIAVAAIVAAFASGLAGIVAYLPDFTFARWFGRPFGDWLDAFVLAFLSTLIVTLPGVLGAPDFGTLKAIVVGAITGALAAGVRAVVGILTPGETPTPASGLPAPPRSPA